MTTLFYRPDLGPCLWHVLNNNEELCPVHLVAFNPCIHSIGVHNVFSMLIWMMLIVGLVLVSILKVILSLAIVLVLFWHLSLTFSSPLAFSVNNFVEFATVNVSKLSVGCVNIDNTVLLGTDTIIQIFTHFLSCDFPPYPAHFSCSNLSMITWDFAKC